MYDEFLAEIYDDIYIHGLGKDYRAEADQLAQIISQYNPTAASLLDVACGTGLHLEYLQQHLAHVEGLEASPAMLKRAQQRLPGIRLHLGDMRTFVLDQSYDAITCLFASAGYVNTLEELHGEIRTMARHLNPGGILIIEPWHSPDTWDRRDLTINQVTVRTATRTIIRMTYSTRNGQTSHKDTAYLVGDQTGIHHHHHQHTLLLATLDEYRTALASAGCEPIDVLPGRNPSSLRVIGKRAQQALAQDCATYETHDR